MVTPRFSLITPQLEHTEEYLAAVKRSRRLHRPWAYPPATAELFQQYLESLRSGIRIGYFVVNDDGEIAAFINVGGIIRGPFQSGFLGYSAMLPHAGTGYVSAGLRKVISLAFGKHRLHRLEANIQPGNTRSIELVRRLGFQHEGRSQNYLKVGGRWRDHERFAVTKEIWSSARGSTRPPT